MEKVKINWILFLGVIIFSTSLFFSCKNKEKHVADNQKYEKFETGTHLKFISTKADSTISYDLYLPKNYSVENKYPIIISFDAHARGGIAISRMSSGAEKYGYIVVGSNNVKNGLTDYKELFKKIYNDIKQRIAIDEDRIYLCGFSGGARMANQIAVENSIIKGVVSCGAAFPQNFDISKINFSFYGIVGENDFNYQEFVGLEKYYTLEKPDIYVKINSGTHEWPNSEDFGDALLWLSLKAMKSKIIEENDDLIDSEFDKSLVDYEKTKKLNNNRKFVNTHYELISKFKTLKGTSKYEEKLAELLASDEIVNLQKTQIEYLNFENDVKNQFIEAFENKQVTWWENEIKQLKKQSADTTDYYKKTLCGRLLSFLGMLSYVKINNSISLYYNDKGMQKYFEIYKLVDPQNPDIYYILARWKMNLKEKKLAYENLEKAAELGYFDFVSMMHESEFATIKEEPEFKEIYQKVKNNYINSK